MLSRGYVATSVDAICEAVGVTKGSFFHYFKNKEELGKVLLGRFTARQGESFVCASAAGTTPLERVLGVVDAAIAGARNPNLKGCLVGTLAQEISDTHPGLREVCRASFEGFVAWYGAEIEAARASCAPDSELDAHSLAHCFLSLAQGSMLLMRTNGDRLAMERNLKHFRTYLGGLLGA